MVGKCRLLIGQIIATDMSRMICVWTNLLRRGLKYFSLRAKTESSGSLCIGELRYKKYIIQKYKNTLVWSRGGLCVGDLPTLLWAGVRPGLVGQCGPSVTVLVNLSWILIASSIINYWWHSSNPRPQPQCKSDSSSSWLSKLPAQFFVVSGGKCIKVRCLRTKLY